MKFGVLCYSVVILTGDPSITFSLPSLTLKWGCLQTTTHRFPFLAEPPPLRRPNGQSIQYMMRSRVQTVLGPVYMELGDPRQLR